MGPTRRVEIYQDEPSTSGGYQSGSQQAQLQGSFVRGDDHLALNPSSSGSNGRSPLKAVRQSTIFPPRSNTSKIRVMLPVPQPASFKTDSPTKPSTITGFSSDTPSKSISAMFSAFPSNNLNEKENCLPRIGSDNIAEFPDPSRIYPSSLKRSFSAIDVALGIGSKKARHEEPTNIELPDPRSLPPVEDDGAKPALSYAALIGMAILRSPERKLTLAQIYKWISDSFAHYRRAKDSGWQNSIRHNLSLNKIFTKQERPKDDPGKGNYWIIVPGNEAQFLHKDRPTRRTNTASGTGTKASSRPPSSQNQAPLALPPASITTEIKGSTQAKEPSSDATIPASDAPSSADGDDVALPLKSGLPPSSPLQDIRSSPPLLADEHGETPSPVVSVELPSFHQPERRRREHAEMDDSGYFSCLESSVLRPYAEPKLPRLDGSLPKMKRGRAEEAIARMRSSSHDVSPSRIRSFNVKATPSLVSSSPSKAFEPGLMLPPLTPAVKLKMPAKPPPSASPNTNLRLHRESVRNLIGSPFTPAFGDNSSYSPAFKIADDMSHSIPGHLDNSPDVFIDDDYNEFCRPSTSPPIKQSGRRSDRARRTSTALADITGFANSGLSLHNDAAHLESPLRAKSGTSPLQFGAMINDPRHEDSWGLNFLDDEEPDDFGGFDISKGFSKIGSSKPFISSAPKNVRPGMGERSQTSSF